MKKFLVILLSIFVLTSILLIPSFAQNRTASSVSIATDKVYLFFDYVDDEDDAFESFDLELKMAGGIWRVVETFSADDMSSIDMTYKIPDSILNSIEANASFCDYRLRGVTPQTDVYSSSVRVNSSGVQTLIASFDSPVRIVWNPLVGANSYNIHIVSSSLGTLDFYTDGITTYFVLPSSVTVSGLLPADTIITVRTTINGVTYSCDLRPLAGNVEATVFIDTSIPRIDFFDPDPSLVNSSRLLYSGVNDSSVIHFCFPGLIACISLGGLVFIINKVH